MKTLYKKLVRDKIPNIIRENNPNVIIKIRTLTQDEDYLKALMAKLLEEANELIEVLTNDPKNKNAIIEEIADIKEVLRAILVLSEIDTMKVIDGQVKKRVFKGGFEERVFLEEVLEC